MNALARWERALNAWDLPNPILDSAPASPWKIPRRPMRRRAEQAIADSPLPGTVRAGQALPAGGIVLDVGAGPGAASLPLAQRASTIVAVDRSEEMLAIFADLAERNGTHARTIAGTWPDIAPQVPAADVVVCCHVLYNVADLRPFVVALDRHVNHRVVIELPVHYPHAWMARLWQHFHGLDRPEGPTAGDAQAALLELDLPAHREETVVGNPLVFADRGRAIAAVRRRLCLTPDRDHELAQVLAHDLWARGDGWSVGPRSHRTVVLWWDIRRESGPA